MERPRTDAFYLPRGARKLFCLLVSPPAGLRPFGSVLHVPAFAEEMNKSRRAVAASARALAARGWQVLVIDPGGTGDSSGDFGDADWIGWVEDVCHAAAWLERQSGALPALWGLRAGCLLINDALPGLDCRRLIFWQPVLSGEIALAQFLRLRTVASAAKSAGGARETTKSLVAALENGQTIEVAGYRLSPALALPLRQTRLGGPAYAGRQILWFEVSAAPSSGLSPASEVRIAELRGSGASVAVSCVEGLGFWMTQEIDESPGLVAATVAALQPAAGS